MTNPPSSDVARVRVRVTGLVQGVWYRASTRNEAERLGVVGWVKNLPDGSVRLEAEGPASRVEELVRWCHEGPPSARVAGVEVEWVEPTADEDAFVITR